MTPKGDDNKQVDTEQVDTELADGLAKLAGKSHSLWDTFMGK
jgi:hypothetical protein